MKQFITSKLLRKFFTLIFLLFGIFVVLSNDNNRAVGAWGCCEDCDALQHECEQATDNGDYDSVYQCMVENAVFFCYRHCEYCGGGNTGCIDSSDCPPGCTCTGDRCQCI